MNGSATRVEGHRLVMYRESADEPAYWDALWRANPPVQAKGEPISAWFREAIETHFPRDGLIVEAGCGNGNIMRTIAGAGYEVEGLDFAPEVIEANEKVDPAGRYRVGDVRRLPYEDGSIGGYISLGVVEHFDQDERDRILREASRALRVGGAALITTPMFSPLRRARASLGGFRQSPGSLPFYQYFFDVEELAAQVEASGLRVVRTDAYDVYKGLKDTLKIKGVLDLARRSRALRRWLHHPPRAVRLMAGHMGLVVAVKPGEAGVMRRAA